jgi:uroporphyrinogen-III decarboxylase
MKQERWSTPQPDADSKRQARLSNWSNTENIKFDSKEAKEKFEERCQIVIDAVTMAKIPKRVPIAPSTGYFPIEHAGISWKDAMSDYHKVTSAFEKFDLEFNPDTGSSAGAIPPAEIYNILDYKPYLWAGHGLENDQEYQYVEGEYLKADEYQDFIDDPTGWFLNVYYPRAFGALDGFDSFPVAIMPMEILMVGGLIGPFGKPEMKSAMSKIMSAAEEMQLWAKALMESSARSKARGFIHLGGGMTKAPLDVLGDTLRGTREIMMDYRRRPEEVKEACNRLIPLVIKGGVRAANSMGQPFCMIPLHKGADGFMSKDQFDSLYWPSCRKMIIGLIDAGVIPIVFAEGSYESRLETVADLPKGTVIWRFEKTDMKHAKETVGVNNCIMGNVPLQLLCSGSTTDVEEYCKKLIKDAGKGGGFILSTSGGMQGVKADNVKAMIECSKKFGVY